MSVTFFQILVVIEPLLIDEDYYARVEGREIISNLAKVRDYKKMIFSRCRFAWPVNQVWWVWKISFHSSDFEHAHSSRRSRSWTIASVAISSKSERETSDRRCLWLCHNLFYNMCYLCTGCCLHWWIEPSNNFTYEYALYGNSFQNMYFSVLSGSRFGNYDFNNETWYW